MKHKVKRFAVAILIYVLGVFIIAAFSYTQERQRFLADIDQRLLAAASNIPSILPADFHDIARTPDAITAEQDQYNLELMTRHTRTGDLTYLYTYVMVDGMIYFTSCNYTQADIENNKVVTYWTDYPEGAQEYFDAMTATEPVYVTAGDTWGLFRTILMPMKSPSGLPYIAAADMDITVIENSLKQVVLSVIGMSLVLLAIVIPLILAYRSTYIEMNTELRKLNKQLQADIDQALVLEAELKKATYKANTANEIKSQFLSHMSHELRTPINGISGMNELLLDTDLTQEQVDYVELCNKSADVLLDTVNQILDVAAINASGLTMIPEVVDSEEFFEGIVSLFSSQIAEKRLDLIINFVGEVPKEICIDPLHLRKVLINLVGNAIKFTERGGISILISWRDGVLRGEVKDTGKGIPSESQGKIFEAFQQADNSYARKYSGTGLGLPISQQICQLMGGDLSLHSSDEQGSMFKFHVQVEAHGAAVIATLPRLEKSTLVCSASQVLHTWAASELGAITIIESRDIKQICSAAADHSLILVDGTFTADELKQLAAVTSPNKQKILWMAWVGQHLGKGSGDNVHLLAKPLIRSHLAKAYNQTSNCAGAVN